MRFSLTCPRCDGTGRLRNTCPTCHGDGRISTTETVEVRIPPGAQQGSRLRVAGKGNAGTMGAPAGDLYITMRVEPHPFFRREGDDIEINVPVRIDEAGLGDQDRSSHHRRPRAAEDSAGHQERPEIPAAGKRRAQFAHRQARRPDRGSGDRGSGGAGRTHQGTAARIRAAASGRSARRIWAQQVIDHEQTQQSRVHDLGGGRAVPDPSADAAAL